MAAEKVVLVFGGSGTIGSGIIKALLKSGKGLFRNMEINSLTVRSS